MHILIAEDDPSSRLLLEKMLAKQGHTTVTCENGLQALLVFQQKPVRMIISDWMMPELDGIGLVTKIRGLQSADYVYIILLTTNSEKSDAVRGLNAGADDYMTKPFDPAELAARIRSGERILALEDDRKKAVAQILKSEKMAAIGTLTAGVAHEINTPLQYLAGNLRFLREAFGELDTLLASGDTQASEKRAAGQTVDLAYLREEIPLALEQSLEGVAQVTRIVQILRDYAAHKPGGQAGTVDLNQRIENSLAVARHTWQPVAELVADLDPHLPPIPGYPDELGQVVLNLILNAVDAVKETRAAGRRDRGTIRVKTFARSGWVEMQVSDSGCGIPEAHRSKVFDLFFTTKEVGRGTGQGLAYVYSAVVDHHGGVVDFESRTGEGTTFTIRLPLEPGDSLKRHTADRRVGGNQP